MSAEQERGFEELKQERRGAIGVWKPTTICHPTLNTRGCPTMTGLGTAEGQNRVV